MKDTKYYSLDKILAKKDLDGLEPTFYLITSNRSAGKTTATLERSLEKFKESGSQTILLYRYSYECNSAPDSFKEILARRPEFGEDIKAIPKARGLFYELYLGEEVLGYSMALNNVDAMKKFSPLFFNVDTVIMDEFQTESGKYLPHETKKFQSILVTIARGGGEQSRAIKVFLLGNNITVMNPYFIQFGIHKRIKNDTNFMRGRGWVAEFGFNESASTALKNNGIFRAFSEDSYATSSTDREYLYDSSAFIKKPKGAMRYICTIKSDSQSYGVREYYEDGYIYVSKRIEPNWKDDALVFKAGDHNQNTIMLSRSSWEWKYIKEAYQKGYLYFDDMGTKSAIFDILAVDLYK